MGRKEEKKGFKRRTWRSERRSVFRGMPEPGVGNSSKNTPPQKEIPVHYSFPAFSFCLLNFRPEFPHPHVNKRAYGSLQPFYHRALIFRVAQNLRERVYLHGSFSDVLFALFSLLFLVSQQFAAPRNAPHPSHFSSAWAGPNFLLFLSENACSRSPRDLTFL